MFTYTVTIGRNLTFTTYAPEDTHQDGEPTTSHHPMVELLWETFIDEVAELLSAEVTTEQDAVEIHRGTGTWGGVPEENALIGLRTHFRLGVNGEDRLRRGLARIAATYSQDAIALTIGQSELVKP